MGTVIWKAFEQSSINNTACLSQSVQNRTVFSVGGCGFNQTSSCSPCSRQSSCHQMSASSKEGRVCGAHGSSVGGCFGLIWTRYETCFTLLPLAEILVKMLRKQCEKYICLKFSANNNFPVIPDVKTCLMFARFELRPTRFLIGLRCGPTLMPKSSCSVPSVEFFMLELTKSLLIHSLLLRSKESRGRRDQGFLLMST